MAVAIDSSFGHLGIFHSAGSKQACQLHLCRHNVLRCEPIDEVFQAWIALPISSDKANVVAAYCRLFAEENADGEVPYGFSPPDGALTVTGHLEAGVIGLTCASLVLAIFDRAELPLVDYLTWPVRPEDQVWQEWIVDILRKNGELNQMKSVEQQIPATRYRPVEVAAAAACEGHPVDFETTIRAVELFKLELGNLF